MSRKKRSQNNRSRQDGTTTAPRAMILASSVALMDWRLKEAAAHIGDAVDAIARGDHDRTIEHLLEIEPLVFESQRILSAVFLMTKEAK